MIEQQVMSPEGEPEGEAGPPDAHGLTTHVGE